MIIGFFQNLDPVEHPVAAGRIAWFTFGQNCRGRSFLLANQVKSSSIGSRPVESPGFLLAELVYTGSSPTLGGKKNPYTP